jgi:hypothetical protein
MELALNNPLWSRVASLFWGFKFDHETGSRYAFVQIGERQSK